MRRLGGLVLALLAAGGSTGLTAGCGNPPPPAPDELALGRYEEGKRLYDEKRWAEAAAEFEAVVAVRERIRDAWWFLADCHERLGDRPAAAGALRRWLRVDPTDAEARRRLEGLGS
jgi:tetratricopeptide (TPR) repeat protein